MDTSSRAAASAHPRFDTLDAVRGIAALLIVLRHTPGYFGALSFPESYLGVDIFFLLSGIVIASSYERKLLSSLSFRQFALIRIARLYPCYFLGCVLGLIVFLSHGGSGGVAEMALFAFLMLPNFANLRGGDPNPYPLDHPAWSLFSELVVNFIYAEIVKFLSERTIFALLCATAAVLCAGIYASPEHTLDIGWKLQDLPMGIVRSAYSFFFGIWLYRKFAARRRPAAAGRFAPVYLVFLISAIAAILTAAPAAPLRPYFDAVCVLFVFPALIYACLFVNPRGILQTASRFLGGISYPVYVLHQPAGTLVSAVLRRVFAIDVAACAPFSGVVFICCLAAVSFWLNARYEPALKNIILALPGRMSRAR
ncbi:MAG: acyltransferase [Alphaproteobacteria bacterium]|nr:acyltransferase [Alphaproteobacteria bacterium]